MPIDWGGGGDKTTLNFAQWVWFLGSVKEGVGGGVAPQNLWPAVDWGRGQETISFRGHVQRSFSGWDACHPGPTLQGPTREAWTRSAGPHPVRSPVRSGYGVSQSCPSWRKGWGGESGVPKGVYLGFPLPPTALLLPVRCAFGDGPWRV